MPVLYLIGLLYYFIFYWVYKVLILKYFQKATTFNQTVAIKATNMIHFAIVWHIVIASLMFSNTDIFGSESDKEKNGFFYLVERFELMASRFTTHYSLNFIGWNLILSLVYLCAVLVVKGFTTIYQIYIECRTPKRSNIDAEQKVDNSGFYKDLSFEELRNLNRRVRQERKEAEQYLKTFEKDIAKNEYLRGHLGKLLTKEEREFYRKWLRTRQNSIRGII